MEYWNNPRLECILPHKEILETYCNSLNKTLLMKRLFCQTRTVTSLKCCSGNRPVADTVCFSKVTVVKQRVVPRITVNNPLAFLYPHI